ncbi:MAG: hypothetical protein EOM50_12660 [Erysipelotrichia bacterium]|nr:hypothetical protein [Erysipelotrichia bacterium]
MKHKTSSLKIGIGTPTILMIFVVLCMTILSVLSFMEANTNRKLINKEITYSENYYQANATATKIQNALLENKQSITSLSEQYLVEMKENDTEIEYYVTIDDKKYLHVILDKKDMQISKMWKVENKEDK